MVWLPVKVRLTEKLADEEYKHAKTAHSVVLYRLVRCFPTPLGLHLDYQASPLFYSPLVLQLRKKQASR